MSLCLSPTRPLEPRTIYFIAAREVDIEACQSKCYRVIFSVTYYYTLWLLAGVTMI